jgi:T4 bacteriophage base plate protein
MKLPTIDQPVYEATLLFRNEPVKYRPFTVKEQKLMMMAVEANEIDSTMRTIKQIISNCLLEPIDVNKLPLADLETLFLNLRARSMGEVLSLFFNCKNKVIVPPTPGQGMIGGTMGPIHNYANCDMVIEVPVNLLTDVKQINNTLAKKIMFNSDVGVIMKYPTIELIDQLLQKGDSQVVYTVIAGCIDQVFDKNGVYKSEDATPEEMITFIENLPADKIESLEKFVENVPRSRFETLKKCSKCGYEHKFVLEGLNDFFT